MIKVVVVDLSAQSRQKVLEQVGAFIHADDQSLLLLPRITLSPLSPQEVKFHEAPDVCVLGPELLAVAPQDISVIRKAIPESVILARLPADMATLAQVEKLARLGVDDVLEEQTTAAQFLRKMILLKGRRKEESAGRLILVDSGKGGIGTTSITAALGEAIALSGHRTALVDGDLETQDLSRFLQVRPFINENLRSILDAQRSLSAEAVDECLFPVWDQQVPLWCMPPPTEDEALYQPQNMHVRMLLSVLEVLNAKYEVVLVDSGALRGEMKKALYRASDAIVFLVNNDPASLYASADHVSRVAGILGHEAQLLILQNCSSRLGLPNCLLMQEFLRAAKLERDRWCELEVPFSKNGARWPASGGTLYSQSDRNVIRAIDYVLVKLQLKEAATQSGLSALLSKLVLYGKEKRAEAARLTGPATLAALPVGRPIEGQMALPEPVAAGLSRITEQDEMPPERMVSGVKFK